MTSKDSRWGEGTTKQHFMLLAMLIIGVLVVLPLSVYGSSSTWHSDSGTSNDHTNTMFSTGNSSTGYNAQESSNNWYAQVTGGTVFTSNGDGTYNTSVYSYDNSNTNNGGGGGGGTNGGGGSGGGGCSGKGACSGGGTTSGGPSAAAPTGHYEQQCTSSGKGAQTCNQVWVPDPVSVQASAQAAQSVPPLVSITATPSIVRVGGTSRISWDGGLADGCIVSGPGLSSHAITGSQEVGNIQEPSVYTIQCVRGNAPAQASTRVDIVPLWREY